LEGNWEKPPGGGISQVIVLRLTRGKWTGCKGTTMVVPRGGRGEIRFVWTRGGGISFKEAISKKKKYDGVSEKEEVMHRLI